MNPPPCRDIEPLLDRFADGEGDSDTTCLVREHLGACPDCRTALRSILELGRRVARTPGPAAPPDLELRIRRALNGVRPARRWKSAAAVAAMAACLVVAILTPPRTARAETVPDEAAGSAYVHRHLAAFASLEPDQICDAIRSRVLPGQKVVPVRQGGSCEGACPCSLEREPASWILYRRGGTPVSLLLLGGPGEPLPDSARRSPTSHAFSVRGATVLMLRLAEGRAVWIAPLPESDLLEAIRSVPEGRETLDGRGVSIHAILCQACCGRGRDRELRVESLRPLAVGQEPLDLDWFIRELKELGNVE